MNIAPTPIHAPASVHFRGRQAFVRALVLGCAMACASVTAFAGQDRERDRDGRNPQQPQQTQQPQQAQQPQQTQQTQQAQANRDVAPPRAERAPAHAIAQPSTSARTNANLPQKPALAAAWMCVSAIFMVFLFRDAA